MDHWQMLKVIKLYDERVAKELASHPDAELVHLKDMFPKMVSIADKSFWMAEPVKSEQWDKVNRWLGFVQGVLWNKRIYTIDDMREHNRGELK